MPSWQVRPLEEKQIMVRSFLDKQKTAGWGIDDNYTVLYWGRTDAEGRFDPAHEFWPRPLRAARRFWYYRGCTRVDMAEGCKEKWTLFLCAGFCGIVVPAGKPKKSARFWRSTRGKCIWLKARENWMDFTRKQEYGYKMILDAEIIKESMRNILHLNP